MPDGTGPAKENNMFTLEMEARTTEQSDHDRDTAQAAEDALTEVLRLVRDGFTSGYLHDCEGSVGYWELNL